MERAVERRGGREALEEETEGFQRARREERHAGFEDYREGHRARRASPERENDRGEEPAILASAPSLPPASILIRSDASAEFMAASISAWVTESEAAQAGDHAAMIRGMTSATLTSILLTPDDP